MSATRPYEERDRDEALRMLGGAPAFDLPISHAHVAEAGPAEGIALWLDPAPGEDAHLGAVAVPPAASRGRFYRLVLACAEEARALGHTHGRFVVQDGRLLARIQRDFVVAAEPVGWEPATGPEEPRSEGRAVQWQVRVELEDAIGQLRRVLQALGEAG